MRNCIKARTSCLSMNLTSWLSSSNSKYSPIYLCRGSVQKYKYHL